MWFLYLDESGDLGFDFVNKKPSKFFTITIVAIKGVMANRALINSVKHTLKRKLYKKETIAEIKGSKTSGEILCFFYNQCKRIEFGIYSLTLNKKRLYAHLAKDKARVYNYVARLAIEKIPLQQAGTRIYLIVDKSKARLEIAEFNTYIMRELKSRIDPKVPLDIFHHLSHENLGLQAADMFCWGIFRKYERRDTQWFDVFWNEKGRYDSLYLP